MKRDIYSELMDGLDALSKERQDKISLKKTRVKRIGAMKGKLTLPEEFDASLTHSLLDAFER
ncbi:type II toxin-antitoxin system prevent-host-death family antitoxin [Pseudomonas sp. PB106]|nr:type II toxin-antitoxin system prevent-host-death family antitoxin [Pseudomonas sp. PB106]